MKHLILAAGILSLLLPAAFAEEQAVEEPPGELFFRMEVGAEAGHFVAGKIVRTGEEWNKAALDMDGDGNYEKQLEFAPTKTAGLC